jgi:hypothetical protein
MILNYNKPALKNQGMQPRGWTAPEKTLEQTLGGLRRESGANL